MYIAYNSVLQYHAVTLIGYICIVSTNKDDSIVCLYICSQQSSAISQVIKTKINMRRCVVFGCNSDTTCINISFHKLPEVLCSKWKAVIGRGDDFVVKKYQRICSLHFTSANFKRNKTRNTRWKFVIYIWCLPLWTEFF